MTLVEKIWGNALGSFIAYGKTAAAAALKPLLVTDNGDGTGTLVVSASSSALPTGAATESTLSSIKTAVEGALPTRSAGVLHRSAIALADKCTIPTLATKSTSATGGLLEDSTTYYVAVAPGNNGFGTAGASNVLTQATAADAVHTHSITLTIPQVVGADYYDIFASVDAAPKWLGRITEAQRAAGGYQIATYATVTSGGENAAGTILIGCVGTGIQTSNAVFAANNACVVAGTGVACVGYSKAYVFVQFSITDLRSAPSLSLIPILESKETPPVQYCGNAISVPVMAGAVGQSMQQVFEVDVHAASKFYVLVGSIAGQGAAVDLWVELA